MKKYVKRAEQRPQGRRSWLGGCPRCKGDLFQTGDIWGDYIACLQCGRELIAAEAGALASTPPPTPVAA